MTESPKMYGGYTLERLKELERNATAGEWCVDPPDHKSRKYIECVLLDGNFKGIKTVIATVRVPANRDLIIAYRSALPALIEEIERRGRLLAGFLACPEIADCAPGDKDPETDELERQTRSALSDTTGEE